jgi:hypothetical protein
MASPDSKEAAWRRPLDSLHRDSLWCLTIKENGRVPQDAAEGHPLPRRSARAATALEALLLLSCPIIRRVYRSALSSPRSILQSRLSALRDRAPLPMIRPVRGNQSPPVIGGRPHGLPQHSPCELRTGNGLPRVRHYLFTLTTTSCVPSWLRSEARGPVLSIGAARTSAATQLCVGIEGVKHSACQGIRRIEHAGIS